MSRERLVVVRLVAAGLALVVTGASPSPAGARTIQPEVAPRTEESATTADEAANDPEAARARELAQQGRAAYWDGDYRQAIEAFDAAHAIVADPNLLYNISAAYEKLGDYDKALEYLDRYAPEAAEDEREAIAARRRELERAKAEASPREPEPVEGPSPDPGPPVDAHQPARVMNGATWALVGVAGAGLGVGVGFGVAALTNSRDGGDRCFADAGSLRCPTSARGSLEAARRDALIADIGFGVAVLAAAATLAIVGVRLRARKQAAPATDVSWRGFGATVRF